MTFNGLLCLCLTLTGCTFIPKYHRPPLPVPEHFANTNSKIPSAGVTAYAVGRRDFFKDPRLRKLIGLALQNNRDYRVALLNVQEIQAQYRIVNYAFLPTFEIDADNLRQRALTTGNKFAEIHNYTAEVNSSYELDLFGHIRSLQAQVLEQYLATQEASRAAQITLVAEVATQYLNMQALDEQLALAGRTLSSVQSYYGLIEKSYKLGNSSALDLQLAQTQVQTVRVAIAGYERQLAQAKDALTLLVGEALPADLPAPRPLESQDLMEDLAVGLSSDLLERRPDILEAEHNLKAANANIGAVKAAFFPSITLTASDGTASVKLTQLFEHNVWSFEPQISLPLFNQTTNFANLNAARVSEKIAIAQYEKAVQTAFSEVSDAIAARDTLNEQIKAQRKLVKAEEQRYDLSQARYLNGIDSYLTVLLAQQDLLNAKANLIQVSAERLDNLISLYKALGGGWK
ncbi:MAG: efflux transporter outer membrane subunit [Candidatus Omnitrophica bacterium]|nr:efflux transporter outer membrane subunit [Candidatus Omnitrophota bacterium]